MFCLVSRPEEWERWEFIDAPDSRTCILKTSKTATLGQPYTIRHGCTCKTPTALKMNLNFHFCVRHVLSIQEISKLQKVPLATLRKVFFKSLVWAKIDNPVIRKKRMINFYSLRIGATQCHFRWLLEQSATSSNQSRENSLEFLCLLGRWKGMRCIPFSVFLV